MAHPKSAEALTILDKETRFIGALRFESSVVIRGYFEGMIEATGSLTVELGAEVVATIRARRVTIAGKVTGDCLAEERMELTETGRLQGNIKTRVLKIADGVDFQGKCEMLPAIARESVPV
ncbi:MAG: polymer-forming cytoskeletal protein [Spirochaetia bacterium]|nr:polymer-forming cytoskeletal protein [Spirochaetia bacterium]